MPSQPRRVLLVDDNDDVRETSADMLKELGYCVLQAANGFEALDKLAKHPELEVMVTDVRMPGMSGFELCDLASARYRTLKMVMMSGYFAPQATTRRLIRKPFRTVELDIAIQEVLAE
ncbi:MAG: response regulator [Acetobacteraceae bacterium]|nr:response regulator [Acetobacteraceae bacterium]